MSADGADALSEHPASAAALATAAAAANRRNGAVGKGDAAILGAPQNGHIASLAFT